MYQPSKELTVQEIIHPCLPQWRRRVDEAEKRGAFDESDEVLAAGWDQCAVGEAHVLYSDLVQYKPNSSATIEYPRDEQLYKLGMWFSGIVGEGFCGFEDARLALSRIEQRLSELQNLAAYRNILG